MCLNRLRMHVIYIQNLPLYCFVVRRGRDKIMLGCAVLIVCKLAPRTVDVVAFGQAALEKFGKSQACRLLAAVQTHEIAVKSKMAADARV